MKNGKNVIIIVLSLIIVGLVVVYFTVLNKNEQITEENKKTYICIKDITTVNEDEATLKHEVNYNHLGEVTTTLISAIYKYSDKESYKIAKENAETTNKKTYDDINNKIEEIIKEKDQLRNEEGNYISIWIKDHIEVLTDDGYNCIEK